MNVGILGSGDVGKALAKGFLARGHAVTIGSRDPGKLAAWQREAGERAHVGTFAQAAAFGKVAVLATLFTGTKAALDLAGASNFAGKVVVDVTNPLKFDGGKPSLSLGFDDSAGESVQRWLPDARVVKAFNTVGHQHMVDPQFPAGPPDMPIAGNDAEAKRTVGEIARSFGWNVVDLGAIEESRYLEPLCMIWVDYGRTHGTWDHAFKILRK